MALDLDPADFPDDFDTEALARCYEAMESIVPRLDQVRLTITSDFVSAVRDAHGHADYAAQYEQDRGRFGSAVAKVIPQQDGTIKLVVDARLLAKGHALGFPERTFEHEAYHIAIHQRNECLFDLGLRGTDTEFGAEARYLAMAGVACEEYRVEFPLCRDSTNGQYDSFPALLTSFDNELRKLSRDYQQSQDVAPISKGVMQRFHEVATASGYVAAAMGAAEVDLPTIDPRVARRVFPAEAANVIESLKRLPPADVEASAEELEAAAHEVAAGLKRWLSEVGFRWDDGEGGNVSFRVLQPVKWLLPDTVV